MYIKSITIDSYRNYKKVKVDLDPQLNLIIGDNAQGKTNLLESIYFACFGKSFRTSKDSEIIPFDDLYASVHIQMVRENGLEETVEYRIYKGNKKKFLVNGVNITKISELLGTLNVILFYPDDLRLIKDSPQERRRFINRELSQMSKIYCSDLIDYNKILYQRNELLKKLAYKPDLLETMDVWNEQLAEKGSKILSKRYQFCKQLDDISKDIHKKITNGKEELSVAYQSAIPFDRDITIMKENLLSDIHKNTRSDIKRGFSSVGPHRDDLDIKINGINSRSFGSQGQQRTAALSLKLSEIDIVKSEVGEAPILLLDDVMSELDINRQKDLVYMLKDVQAIITTTDINNIVDHYINDSKTIQIISGNVIDHRR